MLTTSYRYVLDQILSGEMTEVVVERIHEYLTIIGANVREGKIKLDEFIVFKRLGKDPEQYPDAKTQPHVQVALRMKARGGSAKAGDVIPYIFCIDGVAPPKEEDEKTEGKPVIKKEQTGGSKTSQAERAKHPDEIKKAGSGLVVGAFLFSLVETVFLILLKTMSTTSRIRFCLQ